MLGAADVAGAIAEALTTEALPFGAAPLPPGLEPPFVAVTRVGGTRADMVIDAHAVEFDCYAADWAEADAVAGAALGMVAALAGTMLGGVQCYGASVQTLPYPSADPSNETLARVTFACDVTTRAKEV